MIQTNVQQISLVDGPNIDVKARFFQQDGPVICVFPLHQLMNELFGLG